MITLEERRDRAMIRWQSAATVDRGREAIDGSRWLIWSSRAVLDRPSRLVRGGAGAEEANDLPSTSRDARTCAACWITIAPGERQFVVSGPFVILYFHRRCVEQWAAQTRQTDSDC